MKEITDLGPLGSFSRLLTAVTGTSFRRRGDLCRRYPLATLSTSGSPHCERESRKADRRFYKLRSTVLERYVSPARLQSAPSGDWSVYLERVPEIIMRIDVLLILR